MIYIVCVDKKRHPGIFKKYMGVDASLRARKIGKVIFFESASILVLLKLALLIIELRSQMIILRSLPMWYMVFLIPLIILRRLFGICTVIDLPTPITAASREIKLVYGLGPGGLLRCSLLKALSPFVLASFSKILSYGNEEGLNKWVTKRKTVSVTNFVDVNRFPDVSHYQEGSAKHQRPIRFIVVANLSPWHGVDRLIRGAAAFNKEVGADNNLYKIKIVGDGPSKIYLDRLVRKLNVQEYVEFFGVLEGDALIGQYEAADIGVSTVAPHRWGISRYSPIKTREYAAMGLPILGCSGDKQFENKRFYFSVEPDDSNIQIEEIINWYKQNRYMANEIREFASVSLGPEGFVDQIVEISSARIHH